MVIIRDFIYLDIPRLQSYASQLFEGLPESATKTDSRQAEFGGQVKGRIPFVEGGADTRAVLSAASAITSTLHHQLVVRVLDGLRDQGFLHTSVTDKVPDGGFVLLRGQLQIVDLDSLKRMVAVFPDLSRHFGALNAPDPGSTETRADARRRNRSGSPPAVDLGISKQSALAIVGIIDALGAQMIRMRVLQDGETVATGVVEPEKFVESPARLGERHGYRMGGEWELLAQCNVPSSEALFAPQGASLLDIVEREGLGGMRLFGGLTGAAGEGTRQITPLAVYRTVVPRT